MDDTITLDEANQAVDRHVDGILHALSPSASIGPHDPAGASQPDMPCLEASSDYYDTYLFGQRSYPVEGLEPDTGAAFAAFRAWADANKFSVDAANEHLPQNPQLRAHNQDGYSATLEFAYGRHFVVSVSSPCVWRNGTPESSSK